MTNLDAVYRAVDEYAARFVADLQRVVRQPMPCDLKFLFDSEEESGSPRRKPGEP